MDFLSVKTVLYIHISCGCMALTFLLLVFRTKKGSEEHKRKGRVFAFFGILTAALAISMALINIFFRSNRGMHPSQRAMLMAMGLSAISWIWFSFRALRNRNRAERDFSFGAMALPTLTLLACLFVVYLGFASGRLFIAFFPLPAVTMTFAQLVYWTQRPLNPNHWRVAHIGGMLFAGLILFTGFFTAGLHSVAPAFLPMELRFFIPLITLIPVILWYLRREQKRL